MEEKINIICLIQGMKSSLLKILTKPLIMIDYSLALMTGIDIPIPEL